MQENKRKTKLLNIVGDFWKLSLSCLLCDFLKKNINVINNIIKENLDLTTIS